MLIYPSIEVFTLCETNDKKITLTEARDIIKATFDIKEAK